MARFDEPVDLAQPLMELSDFERTTDREGYAYARLECVHKCICSIDVLKQYVHLKRINLAHNLLENIAPINSITHLLRLDLSHNKIESLAAIAEENALPHLLYLNLSNNQLRTLPAIAPPMLREVLLANNTITTAEDFPGHPEIRALDLKGNKLEGLTGIANMPLLEKLVLSNNGIVEMKGLQALPALTELNVSDNAIESLGGPWAEAPLVSNLDAARNSIADLAGLVPLSEFEKLRTLILVSNPIEEDHAIKHEALLLHPGITSINSAGVTAEDRDMAKKLRNARKAEARERRRAEAAAAEAEEEERRRAEAEGGDDA
eukprot:NODE_10548_length_1344_cov_7.240756.p1 GENE.NODE_10548_length_1344_cov_7.240756~~NODE_10548_length_1344_cov_7.240756.p1  ORF type:complete len:319 (-),score=95.96 NODE_10548_length_1344_cov_7.240756:201-1157(-)